MEKYVFAIEVTTEAIVRASMIMPQRRLPCRSYARMEDMMFFVKYGSASCNTVLPVANRMESSSSHLYGPSRLRTFFIFGLLFGMIIHNTTCAQKIQPVSLFRTPPTRSKKQKENCIYF